MSIDLTHKRKNVARTTTRITWGWIFIRMSRWFLLQGLRSRYENKTHRGWVFKQEDFK